MCSRQQTSIDDEAGGAGNFHTFPCLLSHRQYLFPGGLVDKTGFELCPRETTLLHQNVKTGIRGDVFNRIVRSEEHTSELQSLMRISYAVFCLKKKKK